MNIVFVEYRIEEESRRAYELWSRELRNRDSRVELYEGSDQPGLFVELWHGLPAEEYEEMKAARTGKNTGSLEPRDGEWQRMNQWVPGGAEKVHVWRFNKVR